MSGVLSFSDIEKASARIRPWINRTPVLTCGAIDSICGGHLFFKCENFQKAGAFKSRGAVNAVFSLSDDEAQSGVATHSSGNHAAALALAASRRGIPAYVVMPENAPEVKKKAVEGYGAQIHYCRPTLAAREEKLAQVVEKTGAAFIHPYDDDRVIAGQGTAALELFAETGELDAVIAPVGGGGLLSGTALCARGASPRTEVWAAEPEGADDAFRSFYEGKLVPSVDPDTIADGLLTSLSERTFAIIRENVAGIVTVSEEEIVSSMRLVWERMKIVIEPSSAVPLAALVSRSIEARNRRIGIILSGGNVNLDSLPWQ